VAVLFTGFGYWWSYKVNCTPLQKEFEKLRVEFRKQVPIKP
jgi:hypothetical protein